MAKGGAATARCCIALRRYCFASATVGTGLGDVRVSALGKACRLSLPVSETFRNVWRVEVSLSYSDNIRMEIMSPVRS